jgi:hypothetical protein
MFLHIVALLRQLEQSPPRYCGACCGVNRPYGDFVICSHWRYSSTITPESRVNLK